MSNYKEEEHPILTNYLHPSHRLPTSTHQPLSPRRSRQRPSDTSQDTHSTTNPKKPDKNFRDRTPNRATYSKAIVSGGVGVGVDGAEGGGRVGTIKGKN